MKKLIVLFFALFAQAQVAPAQPVPVVKPLPAFTAEERFKDYFYRTYQSHSRFLWLVVYDTGLDHALNSRKFGREPEDFGHRFGNNYRDRAFSKSILALAQGFTDQDTRSRPFPEHGFWSKVGFSFEKTVLAYKSDGSRQLSIQPFTDMASSAMVHRYAGRPVRIDVVTGAGVNLADRFGDNLLEAFSPELKSFGHTTLRQIKKFSQKVSAKK